MSEMQNGECRVGKSWSRCVEWGASLQASPIKGEVSRRSRDGGGVGGQEPPLPWREPCLRASPNRQKNALRSQTQTGARFNALSQGAITWYIRKKWHREPRRINTWKIS